MSEMPFFMQDAPGRPPAEEPARYPHVPGARRRDTSQAAAEAMKPSAEGLRERALAELRRKPQTSFELARSLKLPFETIQPRTSELQKLGLIEDSGERGAARSPNRTAIRWRPTATKETS